MRVLFINTFCDRGGAAIVAQRLRTVLQNQFGVECFFLAVYGDTTEKNTIAIRNPVTEFLEKSIDRITNQIGLQYQFFPFSSAAILKKIKALNPDVISLHNTHGGYFETALLKRISKLASVVWTLHDMWSFTGNAAHTFGDTSWKSMTNAPHLTRIYPAIGVNTGSFLLRQKREIYGKSDLAIVTPSRWLYDLARQSPVFEGKEILQINNGVDLGVFFKRDKATIRKSLGIAQEAKVLMFSADQLTGNLWKGGEDLIQVLRFINEKTDSPIHLLITGLGSLEAVQGMNNFVIHQKGYVKDPDTMARYFSASDIFIYPTRADNLSNVLIEAIACGTPCVSFDIGGCSEIIQDDFTGKIIPPSGIMTMAMATLELLDRPTQLESFGRNAVDHARRNFSLEEMGHRYYSVFKSR